MFLMRASLFFLLLIFMRLEMEYGKKVWAGWT
jgi:hypothetical protein